MRREYVDVGCDGAAFQGPGRDLVARARHRQWVEETFDDYAEDFERHLVDVLRYNVPAEIRRVLGDFGLRFRRCLDLGCGTGLAGRRLRDLIDDHLEGVDLSSNMLDEAREAGGYDALHHRELVQHLQRQQAKSFDLLVAADVLVYLCEVEGFFREARRVLQPGGTLVFSTEAVGEDEEAPLGFIQRADSERFAHSRAHVEKVALSRGFEIALVDSLTVRMEGEEPLAGDLFVLRVPEDAVK
eukprot:TRINITY_DN29030_c0_g1_i1.p2 TRINITY_DN29030_c0_g1~~TRINITY_DN29030_c0_g1_i1.p2  ORF type:complete len:242 (-),score=64.38 TRINITY_DN29030_c0_g1_i1:208-933(-)